GGGGGGGGYYPLTGGNTVIFSGKAYPLSDVTLIKDAQVVAETKAGPDANFQISLSGISAGTYSFGVWAEDSMGLRSITYTFSVSVTSGVTTNVSGIFMPPTITTDKSEVKKGDLVNILGRSAPQAEISVYVNSDQELLKKTLADASGAWLYKLDTDELDSGDHSARSRGYVSGDISVFSQLMFFKVGTKNVAAASLTKCPAKGDINNDCKVNLIDFSIAAYWWKRPLSQAFVSLEKLKLNSDGNLDLVDFSIMAYYWSG
ncbi:MAG: hypothetical protein NTW60_03680, partial [Candidatus Wolfebacteria bacterium]|nr:hypothetical protein [Candidatus Wolfebacteria bacterium]